MEIICPGWYPGTGNLLEAIPLLAADGVTAIEVGFHDGAYFDHLQPENVEKLLKVLRTNGVRVYSLHSIYGPAYDISSIDDDVQDNGVDSLIHSIELANVLDAKIVIVHASDKLDSITPRQFERARGVLREMGVVAKEYGIVLALENLPPHYLGHTPDEIFHLLEGTDEDAVKVCFDTGHANMSGRFEDFAARLLPYSTITHLHDNDGVEDLHYFPGQGTIPWKNFAQLYNKSDHKAGIMLECVPPKKLIWSEAFQIFRAILEKN